MGCESRPCYSFLVPSTATSRSVLRSLGRRSPSIFRASRSPHHAASVDAEPQRRLAYYASQLPGKDTWFQTIEGYRIYKNVPISRTGSQQYIGREIKKNPGYKPEWGIGDDEMVTVYRPLEEVSSPEAVASFEGKSVLDEHPPDPQVLIDALDEYESISKGHAQNIRVGDTLDDGETSIIADLHVKHPDLNVRVDGGVRDVSCGYTFLLDKDADGRYVQTNIRGNHVAIVPKGRAGPEVGIKDSALKLEIRRTSMSIRNNVLRQFQALGFQSWAKDAKPEEVADAMEDMKDAAKDEDESETEAKREKEKKEAKDKSAKDASRKAARDAGDHPKGCMCDDCMDKRSGKDAKDEDDEVKDADEEEKEKKDKEAKDALDADALILPDDEHAKSEFSVGDAAKLLIALKPAVARSKDKAVKDAYDALAKNVKAVQTGVKDGAPDPFAGIVQNLNSGVNDSDDEVPMFTFFNGKSHADGLKAWNEYQNARQARSIR